MLRHIEENKKPELILVFFVLYKLNIYYICNIKNKKIKNMINYFEDDWNFVLSTDSYKMSHQLMLPKDLESLESYSESRGGDFPYTVFTGFLPILRMIQGVQITKEKINEARFLAAKHFGTDAIFDYKVWEYICDKYDGKLPLKIYAVKEGSVIKTSNALFKVLPLEKQFADLASYVETMLMRVWYPITIGTNSLYASDVARYYSHKTASENYMWQFLLHDFGSRGVTTREQSQYGGAMHLLSFFGSDNFDGIRFLMKHYDNENWQKRFTPDYTLKRGFSVPATEHLVMTLEGREKEKEVYRRLLRMFTEKPELSNIILSIVSDTYDIYDVCKFLYEDEELRNFILNRKANTVLRPDSGDAFEVISKMLDILSSSFGYTYNEKGYKVLNNNLKILQGDGINLTTYFGLIQYFCDEKKWSIENFIFGSGGGLLQQFDRDTLKFAIKCSWAKFNDGTEVDVYKDPITSGGSKKSKKGQLWLFEIDGEHITLNQKEMKERGLKIEDNLLIPVFDCGEVLVNYSIEEVSERMITEFDRIEINNQKNNKETYINQLNVSLSKEVKYYEFLFNSGSDSRDLNASILRREYFIKEIEKIKNL
jgi:nicotinamide phosphoribosyltransferase